MRERLRQEIIKTILTDRKLRLLDPYLGCNHRHKLLCLTCKTSWTTSLNHIIYRGSGCRRCAYEKLGDERRLNLSEIKSRLNPNVRIVTFTKSTEPVQCKCRVCGYEWKADAGNLTHGKGCSSCGGRMRLTLKAVKKRLAILSPTIAIAAKQYVSAHSRLPCRCMVCGHRWSPTWDTLSRGQGCPSCYRTRGGTSIAETEVRQLIERITGWKFPKTYPSWLQGRCRTRTRHLDGYNKRHRVAFEYQGQQHYVPRKDRAADDLEKNKRRDERKRVLCYRYGIRLINIPYWTKDVEDLIRRKLRKAGYPF